MIFNWCAAGVWNPVIEILLKKETPEHCGSVFRATVYNKELFVPLPLLAPRIDNSLLKKVALKTKSHNMEESPRN